MPPASGTADVFYKQILSLSAAGYRVIAVSKQKKLHSQNYLRQPFTFVRKFYDLSKLKAFIDDKIIDWKLENLSLDG